MLKFIKNLFTKRYVSVEDIVASYDPSTQQVGVKKGALDSINYQRFIEGKRFEFNGGVNPFAIIPKPRKETDE